MFERFTKAARTSVTGAQALARESGADLVEPRHLLLAVTESPETVAARALNALGVPRDRLREALVAAEEPRARAVHLDDEDVEALRTIGIDLDEVLRNIDDNLGDDRTGPSARTTRSPKFAKDSKKALELALREAIALKHNYIGTEHLLLGLVRVDDDSGAGIFRSLGVGLGDLRDAVAVEVRRAG